ncbi:hypothetical protein XENOCAPTIV_009964, partial [Xenoophorus captivus]
GSKSFSSCSADDFEKMILSTGGTCLLNVPRPDDAYSAPFCGNRLVDVGEECDSENLKFGPEKLSQGVCVQECEEDLCCEYQTCKLKAGAQCAYGECCSNCQAGSGSSGGRHTLTWCVCFRMGILAGTSRPTVTTEGVSTMMDSAKHCLEPVGSSFLLLCSEPDPFRCLNVEEGTVFGIQPSIITTPIHGAKCFGVDFMLGSDVPDPGMVNEGTKCGDNKVCMNFECRNADVLNYDCDVENKCHRHGVRHMDGTDLRDKAGSDPSVSVYLSGV